MNTFRTHSSAARRLAALVLLVTVAPMAHAQIATMDVNGRNAFVENIRQPASGKGISIYDGNLVRTGEKTSAKVGIIPQGVIQLRENGAKLITESFFKGAKCVAARLIAGELYINGENVCFVTNVGPVSGLTHSRIDLKVDQHGTVLTVIEGRAEMEKPASMWVSTNEQLVVQPNGEYYKQTLDPAAAERTIDWTKKYFNDDPGMSTAAKVGIGAVVAYGLCRMFGGCDGGDGDHNNPPAPPPAPKSPQPQQSEPQAVTQPCCIPYQDNNGENREDTTPADCNARGGRLLTDTNDTCATPVR